jgi:hypothetical protein
MSKGFGFTREIRLIAKVIQTRDFGIWALSASTVPLLPKPRGKVSSRKFDNQATELIG